MHARKERDCLPLEGKEPPVNHSWTKKAVPVPVARRNHPAPAWIHRRSRNERRTIQQRNELTCRATLASWRLSCLCFSFENLRPRENKKKWKIACAAAFHFSLPALRLFFSIVHLFLVGCLLKIIAVCKPQGVSRSILITSDHLSADSTTPRERERHGQRERE